MPAPDLSAPTLPVIAWDDPVIDALGHDPRSTYVERFWLSILGPSTTWLVRHLAGRFDAAPGGYTLELDTVADALGLGSGRGRHSPVVRALHRACQFGTARVGADGTLSVRRHLPPLTRHQADRLPVHLRDDHRRWRAIERDAVTVSAQRRRARRIALALAELGEDVPTTEQRLHRWRIHPSVSHEAAVWAHRLMAARGADGTLADPPRALDPLEGLVAPDAGAGPPAPTPLRPPGASPVPRSGSGNGGPGSTGPALGGDAA